MRFLVGFTPSLAWLNCHAERSISEVKNILFTVLTVQCHSEWNEMKWRIFRQVYVIQTTARRKNLLPSVTASQYNVILKGFALKNLLPSEHIVWDLSHAFEMTEMPFWGAKHRRISTDKKQEIPHTRPQVSVRNDIIVILNAAWAEWRISNKLQKIPHIHSEW